MMTPARRSTGLPSLSSTLPSSWIQSYMRLRARTAGPGCVRQLLGHIVDLLLGGSTPKAEPDRAHANFRRHAHRLQHRGQLDLASMTGRTRGGSNPFEAGENFGPDPTNKRDIERIRQPVIGMPVEDSVVAKARL